MQRALPPDEHARVRAAIADAVASRTSLDLEHRTLAADGSQGWAHSRAVPLLDAGGGVIEWLGISRDFTDRKRAEANNRCLAWRRD